MVDKVVLANVATFQNDTSAVAVINNNNALITTALDNTLSRDGTSPNTMGSNLDMNSNQILNLPSPATTNSPARLVDVVTNPTITVPPVGTSGAVVPLLNTNNTWSGTNAFNSTTSLVGVATFTAIPILPSASITTANIQNNAVGNAQLRQGIARSVVGVTGNATANVADIQGSARQVLAVNSAGTAVAFAQPQGDQLLGTITNDNATGGNIGELISNTISSGSAIALTTVTPSNLTSISLTAGDWDVCAQFIFLGGVTTTVNYLEGSVSNVSATLNGSGFQLTLLPFAGETPFSVANGAQTVLWVPQVRLSLSVTTTVYAVAQASFGTSTCSVAGGIQARRVR